MYEESATVSNDGPSAKEVVFEPWGMAHWLEPGFGFKIIARGEVEGHLEIVDAGDQIVVYAWPTATMTVYQNENLVENFSTEVPDIPPGSSMRSFIDLLFGGPSRSDGRA